MSELKSCPFCGGEAKLMGEFQVIPIQDASGAYVDADIQELPTWVECTKCHAMTKYFDTFTDKDTDDAVEAWNRRVSGE